MERLPPDDCPHNRGLIFTFGEFRNVMTGERHVQDNGGFRCMMCNLLIKKIGEEEGSDPDPVDDQGV